jgi:hypothetical protein
LRPFSLLRGTAFQAVDTGKMPVPQPILIAGDRDSFRRQSTHALFVIHCFMRALIRLND